MKFAYILTTMSVTHFLITVSLIVLAIQISRKYSYLKKTHFIFEDLFQVSTSMFQLI